MATPKIEFWRFTGKNEVMPTPIIARARTDAATRKNGRVCEGSRGSLGGTCAASVVEGGEYGLSSRSFTVGRTTEGFYDTALNEANDV